LKRLERKINERYEENKINGEPIVKNYNSGKHFNLHGHLSYTATSDNEDDDDQSKKSKKRPKRKRGNLSIDFMNT